MSRAGNPPLGSAKGLSELWSRLAFLFVAIVIYRIGTHIPLPGIDPDQLALLFNQNQGTILGLLNAFSGGALERMSILALGIMPYISASIIVQLLAAVTPQLEQLKKEGEQGKRKLQQYTRWGTLGLASIQAVGMSVGLAGQGLTLSSGMDFYPVAVISLITGAVFMMWLGEQINERGIGNGISMLIFAGIVAGIFPAIGQAIEQARIGEIHPLALVFMGILAIAVVYFVVFVERAQRRIPVNYARRQQGNNTFAAQSSHLPLKLNQAGVIPAIFASSLLLFPASLAQWFGQGADGGSVVLQEIALAIGPGQPLNLILFAALIIFFCFFYTALIFNPKDMADNLKKSGAYIPGIRPGDQTARHIDDVMTRLTMVGSLYIALVCLMPQFLVVFWNVPFYLGGTSLLIAVVVSMDLMSQIQAHLMSSQYESLMKKANFRR